ncbi:ABC transporter permease [Cyclobacterium xiamenense]|uniref:ABC transporter permease n=1 Tax=Cyclobacterium xiamenense TaxID=1297121 RepID=UPI0035D07DAB
MNKDDNTQYWDLIIEGKTSLFDLKFNDVWQYRDLLALLVKRDFISFYKQTVFGPLWFFIQPLFTMIVYTFVFGNLAGISTDGLPQPLFYLAGITAWSYFADCISKTSTVFRDNANIFGKVYFPRLIMPLSIVVSNLVRFGVQFLLFLALVVYYYGAGVDLQFSWFLLLFPFLLVLMALFGLGLGLIITALTTKYRDLTFLVTFGVQLMMYGTTVIYPLSSAPEKYEVWIAANPMTAIIETFRYAFLGAGSFSWNSLGYSSFAISVIFILGVLIFNKTERSFVDTI